VQESQKNICVFAPSFPSEKRKRKKKEERNSSKNKERRKLKTDMMPAKTRAGE